MTVAMDKQIGLIQGELGLKDFMTLKTQFEKSFKPGGSSRADMEETCNRLLEVLNRDAKKD